MQKTMVLGRQNQNITFTSSKTYTDFFIVIVVETVQQQVVPSEVFGGLAPDDD